MAEIETRSRMADVWANIIGMSSQSYPPQCRVLPSGEFNDVIPEPRVTLQGRITVTW